MADYDSSLPVRTETDGDVVSKIVDGTGANTWSIDANNIGQVNLNDGTNSLVISGTGGIAISVPAGEKIIVTDGTEDLLVNTDGSITTHISDGLTQVGVDQNSGSMFTTIVDTDGDQVQVTQSGQLHVVNYDSLGGNAWEIDGEGAGAVKIQDGDTPADVMAVNDDGSINVNLVQSTVGDDIHEYATSAGVAAGNTVNVLTYTVTTGKTLLLKAVQAAASGKARVEVKAGTPSSETTRAVFFISTANGFGEITFPQPIEVVAADNVLVDIKNADNQSQDLYAFINGAEV